MTIDHSLGFVARRASGLEVTIIPIKLKVSLVEECYSDPIKL